jgi:hypothetical protein
VILLASGGRLIVMVAASSVGAQETPPWKSIELGKVSARHAYNFLQDSRSADFVEREALDGVLGSHLRARQTEAREGTLDLGEGYTLEISARAPELVELTLTRERVHRPWQLRARYEGEAAALVAEVRVGGLARIPLRGLRDIKVRADGERWDIEAVFD